MAPNVSSPRHATGTQHDPVASLRDISAVVSPVFLVGGSVRDMVMGRSCDDLDVATPLRGEEVEARIRAAGRRPYLVGKRFGTIGFTLDGRKVEVTTFRTQEYSRSGGPGITFVSDLATDLAHRDFTMNAMARSVDGELVDPHGGRSDIGSRTIRCVGRPGDRFDEDPLRMLRAARFVSTLGFSVEQATADAARKKARRILEVSKERWLTELDRLLVGPHAGAGLRSLEELGLLRFVLPELQLQVAYDQNSPWHARTLFEHTIGVVEGVPAELNLRWAALLHDVGKPYARLEKPGRSTYVMHERIGAEIVERIALHLRWPTQRREEVSRIVREHMGRGSVLRDADDAAKG